MQDDSSLFDMSTTKELQPTSDLLLWLDARTGLDTLSLIEFVDNKTLSMLSLSLLFGATDEISISFFHLLSP